MEELLAAIAEGRVPRVLVLHSEHPVLVDRIVAAVKDAVVEPALRAFNLDVIEGKPTARGIITYAQTLPMMGPARLIYVRDLAGLPAGDAEEFLTYCDAPNASSVVLAVASKIDKRQKLYAGLAKRKQLVVLTPPKQLAPWLAAEAKRLGVKIEASAAARLLELVGDDLSRLVMALAQLATYDAGREISRDAVNELIAETREHTVFELTDALGAGQLPRALGAVAALCDQRESAIGVVTMLARYVRQILGIHNARAAGLGRGDLPAALGVPPFVVDKLITAARGYTAARLEAGLQLLSVADRSLKGDSTAGEPSLGFPGSAWSGGAMKTLGRDTGERLLLEHIVKQLMPTRA